MAERGCDSIGKGVAMSRYEPQWNGSVEPGYEMQKKSTERRRNAMEELCTARSSKGRDSRGHELLMLGREKNREAMLWNGDALTGKAKAKPSTVKLWHGIELLSEAKK